MTRRLAWLVALAACVPPAPAAPEPTIEVATSKPPPPPSEPAKRPEPLIEVGVIAVEARARGADGEVSDGDMIGNEPYEAPLRGALAGVRDCARGVDEAAYGVELSTSGAITRWEPVKNPDPACAAALQAARFPAHPFPVVLTVVFSHPKPPGGIDWSVTLGDGTCARDADCGVTTKHACCDCCDGPPAATSLAWLAWRDGECARESCRPCPDACPPTKLAAVRARCRNGLCALAP